jgi:alkanesulfonate monooxygenase SsuD/methylene tetrahydromethanopterin reductase-like flavin-dependent oxidoreductase (luciferase family)
MKFGLFDHVEDAERPLATLFDERLTFAQAADDAGIYCLHVAEHHATPLNMVPVPGIYLGAVARATKRMRLGPLVYLLPLYSPLRLIEEICMLDHLSYGRMEVGVGLDNPRARALYERLGYVGTGEQQTVTYEYVDDDGSRRTATENSEQLVRRL